MHQSHLDEGAWRRLRYEDFRKGTQFEAFIQNMKQTFSLFLK